MEGGGAVRPTTGPTRPRGVHKIALAALFTVGSTLLRFPWSGEGTAVVFCLSAAGALLAVAVLYPLALFLWRRPLRGHPWRTAAAAVSGTAVGAAALFCAARSADDLLRFFNFALLPPGAAIPFSALFLFAAVLLARTPRRGVDLFALIACFAALAAVAVLFLRAIPQFRGEYGRVAFPPAGSVGAGAVPLLFETVFPMFPLAAWFALAVPRRSKKGNARPLLFGVGLGYGILFLCVAQTILTFGAPFAATVNYPYAQAVRVVSVGQYAFRPEILSYLLDHSASLCRVALCLDCLRRLSGRFLPRRARLVLPVAGIALFAFLWLK